MGDDRHHVPTPLYLDGIPIRITADEAPTHAPRARPTRDMSCNASRSVVSLHGAELRTTRVRPWVSALDDMPPLPPTVPQRVKAGLSEVDAPHGDSLAIKHERAARALVSILPYGCATFILRDPDAVVASRPASETARRLVNALKPHGVGSINGAYSAYGRLLSWVVDHFPDSTAVHGSEYSDFCEATSPSQTVQDSFAWLRDRCGVDLPVRAPVSKPFRRPPPKSEAGKLSFSPLMLMGLECLAAGGENEFIRAHAAGWWFLAKARLRFEQSHDFVVNAVAPHHEYRGATVRMMSASVVREKHPDPSKRRPRPLWAVVDGINFPLMPPTVAMIAGCWRRRRVLARPEGSLSERGRLHTNAAGALFFCVLTNHAGQYAPVHFSRKSTHLGHRPAHIFFLARSL